MKNINWIIGLDSYMYCFLQVVLMNITGRIAIPLLPI